MATLEPLTTSRAARRVERVFLYDGAIVPDPEGIITGGHENTNARQLSMHEGEPINVAALHAMLAQIIANNRAGGWRKLKDDAAGGPFENATPDSTSE